jgi:hypothetical protein
MIPRLPSSKKWTALPAELCEQVRGVFTESFSQEAKNGQFFIDGRIYSQELLVRVGYLENGRIRQANFEVSLDFDANKQNALELIHFAVDCGASLMQEFFAQEQDHEKFPALWEAFTIDKKTAYVQLSAINSALESEADRILGEEASSLVLGEDDEAEKEAVVTMLGLNRDDEDFPDEDTPASGPPNPKIKH